jgi:cation:H+ antiporter
MPAWLHHTAAMIAMLVVGLVLTWLGSSWLAGSSGGLARHYHLPAALQGALIAAVGSSMPELSSTVLSTVLHGAFDLGVATIVGSAIFNVLVIPAVAALAGGAQQAPRLLVYRDAEFYLIAVAVLLIVFSLAVIYEPASDARLRGAVTRWMALLPVAVYVLYLYLHQQDAREEPRRGKAAKTRPWRDWRTLLFLGLVLIVIGVEGLVRGVIWLGEVFNTPSFLWGATVLTAGTSLPDALVSVRAARSEGGAVSLTNVLGSSIFDLLIAIPAGILIAETATVDYAVAAPMMGFLTLATVAFFTMMRSSQVLRPGEGAFLLVLYAVFVAWMILEATRVLTILGGPAP